ncbi:hypothetical protein HanOQP8_Chr17g0664661 [Helianthus annuus]|nr:hypothetical protein HanIR_Chr17g0877561 [Helianthus annuus]KAJ0636670.1 hypothetical protein HanOQP8_Chr17g0664661 [Helianthus annuus]
MSQPYQPFTGAPIRPKVSIDNLICLALGLNDEQRETVKEIVFGLIFGYKVTSVPTTFAQWLVSNYDLVVAITSELVKRVFGLPIGPTELVKKKKANKKKYLVIQEFRNQFEQIDSKRLSPLQLMHYILDRHDYGRLFVVNFLVVYFSFLGETTTNNSTNV